MDETDDEALRNAAAAATSGNVADQIREATVEHVWRQLRQHVAPGVLFQVDEGLGFPGTQDDPARAIADATHDAVQDAILAAHDRAALLEAVTQAVLANSLVRDAVNDVSRVASEVAASELQRLRALN